jgi:hypothetical protein
MAWGCANGGAAGMAAASADFRGILAYYSPDTTLVVTPELK